MPEQGEQFDAVVIGSGQGGTPLASTLAGAGRRTALVEREHVGGTCINEGCTPTKTMVASGRVAYLARRAAEYGVQTGPVAAAMAEVRRRKREIVASWRDGMRERLEATEQLQLIDGEARFTGATSLEVRLNDGGTRRLLSDRIFINTGARPALPPLPGLDEVPVLNSTTIMELDIVPEHLLVLGGGYVGVEFGQLFRRLGARVTIVQRGSQLLGREDGDVAAAVAGVLREDGIEVLLDSAARRAARGPDDQIRLEAQTPDGTRTLAGSHLLVAAGRQPNTERLDLAAAGVEIDRQGFVRVNERLETNVAGIWALGDVKGGPAFTHISYHDYTVINRNVLEGGGATTAGRLVPYTIFIDPQLGRVGLTEAEARASGRAVKVGVLQMADVARAIEIGETRGMVKAVVDAETQQILGCAVLSVEGGELMAMLQIAMLGKLPFTALRDGIFAHPTLAESLNSLFYSIEA